MYTRASRGIDEFATGSEEQRRSMVFARFRKIVAYAIEQNAFYRDFYSEHGFSLHQLRSFDDMQLVPIVRKEDLRRYSLEARSSFQRGRTRVNTGGTSGQPLEFYLDADAFAREWAHMHRIWQRVGYHRTDLKLTFRGKNLGAEVVRYNAVHNEFIVSAYHQPEAVCDAILRIVERHPIRYFHGYPSSIYEFARNCQTMAPELVEQIGSSLRGILYGSEYPAPKYRNLIEQVFPVPSVSWYGHSEMAVLAYEKDAPYTYVPMHTYGFIEAVPARGGEYRLIGTSYDNIASPFIRYDTGDIIQPETEGGLMKSFKVTAGRAGDFILDRNGHRVSLTALVFGRHHAVFDRAQFVQVSQKSQGHATVLITLASNSSSERSDWYQEFDTTGVEIDFDIEVRPEPIRTAAGKVPLLVTPDALAGGAGAESITAPDICP